MVALNKYLPATQFRNIMIHFELQNLSLGLVDLYAYMVFRCVGRTAGRLKGNATASFPLSREGDSTAEGYALPSQENSTYRIKTECYSC